MRADITLAKLERDGREGFTNCPQAYFLDNLKEASKEKRTPPDWWREMRKREGQAPPSRVMVEETAFLEQKRKAWEKARTLEWQRHVAEKVGRDKYENAVLTFHELYARTMPDAAAQEAAIREAERHFRTTFHFPELEAWVQQHHIEDNNRRQGMSHEIQGE